MAQTKATFQGFPPNGSIADQIEAQADYYPPSFYATYLSFYGNLQLPGDSLSSQYIPLTTVTRGGQNPKKFVVGILPPSNLVTGRLLDRSASIVRAFNATAGITPQVLRDLGSEEGNTAQQIAENTARLPKVPADSSVVGVPSKFQRYSQHNLQSLHKDVQPMAQALIERAASEGITLILTAGFRTNEQQQKLYDDAHPPGSPPKPFVTGAKGGASRHNYGVAFDVAIIENGKESKKANRDLWNRVGMIGKEIGLEWGSEVVPPPGTDLGHFQYDGGLSTAQLQAGVPPLPAPPPITSQVTGDTSPNQTWPEDGSPAAKEAKKQFSKIADTDLNGSEVGLRFQAAQKAQILALQNAMSQMMRAPPLRMLVNPNSFTVHGEKITQDANWGRNGPIIEHWGNNQDKISGSGSVAGFYALAGADLTGNGTNGPGLTRMARNFSKGYQNFLSLYMIYRNNAGLYLQDLSNQDKLTNLATLGSVYIYYDNIMYIGSFDSFNVTEDDTRPFTLNYNFEFVVRAAFLLDRPTEQGFGYGFPATFQASTAPKTTPGGTGRELGTTPVVVPTNAEIAATAAAQGTGPQPPGSEPGAQVTKQAIEDEMKRLKDKFDQGIIPQDYYFSQLEKLQAQLSTVT